MEGLALTRKMSVQAPLGLNVIASLDTIRLIKEDAEFLSNIWKVLEVSTPMLLAN
jgi:hypothetical protein